MVRVTLRKEYSKIVIVIGFVLTVIVVGGAVVVAIDIIVVSFFSALTFMLAHVCVRVVSQPEWFSYSVFCTMVGFLVIEYWDSVIFEFLFVCGWISLFCVILTVIAVFMVAYSELFQFYRIREFSRFRFGSPLLLHYCCRCGVVASSCCRRCRRCRFPLSLFLVPLSCCHFSAHARGHVCVCVCVCQYSLNIGIE